MAAVLAPASDTLEDAIGRVSDRYGLNPRLQDFIVVSLMDVRPDRLRLECMTIASTLRDEGIITVDQVMELAVELLGAVAPELPSGG